MKTEEARKIADVALELYGAMALKELISMDAMKMNTDFAGVG